MIIFKTFSLIKLRQIYVLSIFLCEILKIFFDLSPDLINLLVVSDSTIKLISVNLPIKVHAHNVDNPLLVLFPDQRVDVLAFLGFHHPERTVGAYTLLFLIFDDYFPSLSSYKALTKFMPEIFRFNLIP